MKYIISPSILSANFANLGHEVAKIVDAGADFVHADIMDNHYAPNLTVGVDVCRSILPFVKPKLLDVHLMCNPVDDIIKSFANVADIITIHPDSTIHLDRSLNLIKSLGMKCGVALNPATSIDCLDYIIHSVDLILLMLVNPGFSNQKPIESIYHKIARVRDIINKNNPDIILMVDGGVSPDNIAYLASMGANAFVSGSAIFKSQDYKATINSMREALKALP